MTEQEKAYAAIDRWLDRMIAEGRLAEGDGMSGVRRRDVSDLARAVTASKEEQA